MRKQKYQEIYYITGSDLSSISSGSAVNDYKFYTAVQKLSKTIPITLKRNHKQKVKFKSILVFCLKIVKASLIPSNIIIIRSLWLGGLPALFKNKMNHKIILNMGCTPFYSLENLILKKNPNQIKKKKFFSILFFLFTFQIEKLLTRKSDMIFVENEKAKKIVEKYGGESSKIYIAPYYVQNYFLPSKTLFYDINNEKPLIIGYTGRFHKYDKLEPLIDAINILKEKGFSLKLKLIGDGPTKQSVQRKVQSLKLNNEVQFLGIQPHYFVSEIIDSEHILILPMVKNICPSTTPIKILEGIIKGKVILTNNTGNIKSMFKPYTDLVLEDFSEPRIIADKILKIAKDYMDYLKIAQHLRVKFIKTHNEVYYRKTIKKILDLIKYKNYSL